MKTVTEFENVKELLDCATTNRSANDKRPFLDPSKNTVIIDGTTVALDSESGDFQLSHEFQLPELLEELARRNNLTIRIMNVVPKR
jgi:hypothetical protein